MGQENVEAGNVLVTMQSFRLITQLICIVSLFRVCASDTVIFLSKLLTFKWRLSIPTHVTADGNVVEKLFPWKKSNLHRFKFLKSVQENSKHFSDDFSRQLVIIVFTFFIKYFGGLSKLELGPLFGVHFLLFVHACGVLRACLDDIFCCDQCHNNLFGRRRRLREKQAQNHNLNSKRKTWNKFRYECSRVCSKVSFTENRDILLFVLIQVLLVIQSIWSGISSIYFTKPTETRTQLIQS